MSESQEYVERLYALPADRVEIRPVEWLWEHRIPRGKITILDGQPGLAKSSITTDLAARITTGRRMPDGGAAPQGAVVLINFEDDPADTIVPRFDAAGGDLGRLLLADHVQTADGLEPFELPDHAPLLEALIREREAVLVVIDPLTAALAGDVKTGIDHHIRRALAPLKSVVELTRCACIVVRHLNKDIKSRDPILRGGGSIGIIGAARAGLVVGIDPDDPTLHVLAVSKSNLAPAGIPSLTYRVESDPQHGVAALNWCGTSERRARDLVLDPGGEQEDPRSVLGLAVSVLREALADGPQPARWVQSFAREAGVSPRTLQRAKDRMGVLCRPRTNGDGRRSWFWSLPDAQGVGPGVEDGRL